MQKMAALRAAVFSLSSKKNGAVSNPPSGRGLTRAEPVGRVTFSRWHLIFCIMINELQAYIYYSFMMPVTNARRRYRG